jgi:hypothetical protein
MKQTSSVSVAAICLLVSVSIAAFVGTRGLKAQNGNPSRGPENSTVSYRLSGPYTHKNLTIFLVHGKDQITGKTFLTLQEALAQKKVIVYETKLPECRLGERFSSSN